MSTTVAELVARLQADASGLVANLAVADKSLATTESRALGLGATLSSMSKGMGEFGLPFVGAVNRLESTVVASSSRSGGAMSGMLATANKVGTGMALAFVAASAEGIHLADKFEVSHAQLETSLTKLGTTAEAQSTAVNKTDSSMEKLGFTYADTEHSLSRLVVATGSVAEAQKAVALSADIARAKGMDLTSATELMVKVEAGHYTLLGRQLGLSAEVIKTFHNSGDAVAYLTAKMSGQSAAFADTFAGKLASTKAKAEDLGVSLGQAVIPAVEKLADVGVTTANVLGQMNDATGGLLGKFALIGSMGLIAMSVLTRIAGTVTGFAASFSKASSTIAAGEAIAAGGGEVAAGANVTNTAGAVIGSVRTPAMAAAEANAALTSSAEVSTTAIVAEGAAAASLGTILGVAAIGAIALGAEIYLDGANARAAAKDVGDLVKQIEEYATLSPSQQTQEFKDVDDRIKDAVGSMNAFRDAAIAANQAMAKGNITDAMAQGGGIPDTSQGVNTEQLTNLHNALQKVIKDQGALAAKPYFDRFLEEVAKIPGATAAIGHTFDDIKGEIKTALDQVNAAAKANADAIGVTTSQYEQFVSLLPSGVQLSQQTETAWVSGAAAAQTLGLSAASAAKEIVDGMTAAAMAATILVDSMDASISIDSGMQNLAKSTDDLATSMGGRGMAATSAATKASKTHAQAMVDEWAKQNALTSAIYAEADAYEALGQKQIEVTRANEDMVVATRDVGRAQEDQRIAVRDLADAQKNYNNVVHGYAAGSSQAKDATKTHRDALLTLQQSQLGVASAQANLTKVQTTAGHTVADVQAAQLQLTQAQFAAQDAQDAYNQSTKDLNETLHGHAKNSKDVQDATDQLRGAQRNLQDATIHTRDALRSQQDALIRVFDANKNLQRGFNDIMVTTQGVARATLDLQGKLDNAKQSMAGMAKNSHDAKIQLDGVESNVDALALKMADNSGFKRGTTGWANAFMLSLQSLRDFIHPTGELATFFDQMIAKYATLVNAIQSNNFTVADPGTGGHVVGGQGQHMAVGGIARGPSSGFPATLHGIEAVLPLGPGQQADRQRVMMEAMRIAPDLGGSVFAGAMGGGARGPGAGSAATGGDTYVNIEEMHNNFLRNDRDLLNRLATLPQRTGRGAVVQR